MQTTFATASTLGRANEDYAVCGSEWALILDGATAPPQIESGCIHDVPWLVRHLAAGITQHLVLDCIPLAEVLADAIETTMKAHGDTCDLSNPDSPSSTVAIIRIRNNRLDYLVLGDSPVILRAGQNITPIDDDRTDHLPGGRPYSFELVRRMRNTEGGFWIASTKPEAAYEAISGSTDRATDAALLTDGVTRLVDYYGFTWEDVFRTLDRQGPAGLIAIVRSEENAAPLKYGKKHDDATAVHARALFQAEDSSATRDAAALAH